MLLTIGPHISSSKGFLPMGHHALALGANTFGFFTRNPRGGNAREIDGKDAMAFRELAAAHGIAPLVAHAAYTMNPCAGKPELRDFTRRAMTDDLARLSHVPGGFYNVHPGSHVGQGAAQGISLIGALLNDILAENQQTVVLLETMSGKGSEVGRSFEELRAILDCVRLGDKVGICLDICHCWDAGYDIRNDLDAVLRAFDETLGLSHLRAVHLNDSMNERGSRKDRHARIGEGHIGLEAIARVINHEALFRLPFILETPNDDEGWKKEIALLRLLYKH